MSIWNLPIQDSEPASGIKINVVVNDAPFIKSEANAKAPIEADCVGSIVTPRGLANNFSKPSGRFHCVDQSALTALSQRIRTSKAEHFKLMVEAEESFNQIFSKDVWPETAPISGIQIKTIQ